MAFSSRAGSGREPMVEINITPFVDVMLVLLVVFMVTAPMIKNNLPINLPKTRSPKVSVEDSKLLLTITKDKKIYLGETEVPNEGLEEALKANARLQTEKEIYVQADAELPYGFVTQIMGIVRTAGIEKLGLVTQPDAKAGAMPTASP